MLSKRLEQAEARAERLSKRIGRLERIVEGLTEEHEETLLELRFEQAENNQLTHQLRKQRVINTALIEELKIRMAPGEELRIRNLVAALGSRCAPYVFGGIFLIGLTFFLVRPEHQQIAESPGDFTPKEYWSKNWKRVDFREQRVGDLQKEHPPGNKTIEEWLDELERAENAKRIRLDTRSSPSFMGGQHDPGSSQWHVE